MKINVAWLKRTGDKSCRELLERRVSQRRRGGSTRECLFVASFVAIIRDYWIEITDMCSSYILVAKDGVQDEVQACDNITL